MVYLKQFEAVLNGKSVKVERVRLPMAKNTAISVKVEGSDQLDGRGWFDLFECTEEFARAVMCGTGRTEWSAEQVEEFRDMVNRVIQY